MTRLLRWLIVAAGLSLFTLSHALHYRIDTYFHFEAPPAAPTIAPDGMVRVELFGLEQKLAVRVFDNRTARSTPAAGMTSFNGTKYPRDAEARTASIAATPIGARALSRVADFDRHNSAR